MIVALEADAADDDTVAVYTPALPYVCAIENAVDCSIAPSPNDQVHVAPIALELTLNTSGTPVVPLPDTFRKETGNVGAGAGAGPLVGTTRVCALSSCPTDAVTSAVSLAVSVADAIPLALVVHLRRRNRPARRRERHDDVRQRRAIRVLNVRRDGRRAGLSSRNP